MLINDIWKLSYEEYVAILLQKYGPATHDYFENGKPAASRAISEGLECHHIDEDKIPGLSSNLCDSPEYAPYQKADRLVYCNRIEHIILHEKIAIRRDIYPDYSIFNFNVGGVSLLVKRMNDAYISPPNNYDWNSRVAWRVRNKVNVYAEVVRRIAIEMYLKGYNDEEIEYLLFTGSDNTTYVDSLVDRINNYQNPINIDIY